MPPPRTRGQPFVHTILKQISDVVASLDDSQSVLDALVGLVCRMLDVNNGLPLGVEANCRFEVTELTLESGDSLVLYTDGITDAVNVHGELFGHKRFEKVLRAHRGASGKKMIDAVARALTRFSAGQPQTDDQTLLVVRKN